MELCEQNSSVYKKIIKNKWLYMFSHMENNNSSEDDRCIYAYEFNDNSVYVGLTKNVKYKNKNQFQKNNSAAYMCSYKNGWLNEFYKS